MRHLLFLLLFLSFSGAWAQDFRCIVPDEDRFYMDGSNMLGLRIIASETVDEGIIHHFNHDLRPAGFNDPDWCNPYSACNSSGMDYAFFTLSGASWMGTHMLDAPDGLNVFFNLNGDSIRVSTLAELGESWTVFQWGDGSRLDATVLTIDPEDVQGMVQAVKTIGLQVLDTQGSMIPHPLNDEQWKLSQHYGFTQVHSLLDSTGKRNMDRQTIQTIFFRRREGGCPLLPLMEDVCYFAFSSKSCQNEPHHRGPKICHRAHA